MVITKDGKLCWWKTELTKFVIDKKRILWKQPTQPDDEAAIDDLIAILNNHKSKFKKL